MLVINKIRQKKTSYGKNFFLLREFFKTKGGLNMNSILSNIIAEARISFEQILESVTSEQVDKQIHIVEGELFNQVIQLGKKLLEVFIAKQGTGNVGQFYKDANGRERDLHSHRTKQYLSIFGKVTITRTYYWRQKLGGVYPLDAKLNLPKNSQSYVLEKWVGLLAAHGAYGEARQILKRLIGIEIWNESTERMMANGSTQADEFYDTYKPSQTEEKELLIISADGKGIPMKKERSLKKKKRLKKGEKPGKKKMSTVTTVYTIERHIRTAEKIVESVVQEHKQENNGPNNDERPKPQSKIVRATLNGKESAFKILAQEVKRRDPDRKKEIVGLVDGEKKLRELMKTFFGPICIILDIFHVLEYLWKAAHLFYSEGSNEAELWTRGMLYSLLRGKVEDIILYLKYCLQEKDLLNSQRNTLKKVIGYLNGGKEHMKYDEYIEKGYPIGSGVVEGACRNLVKDRMERSGMHWTKSGAEAVLGIRSLELNGFLDDYWNFRTKSEQQKLYAYYNNERYEHVAA